MNIRVLIFVILSLFAVVPSQAATTVTASDGTRYELVIPAVAGTELLQPGERQLIGERCDIRRASWLQMETVCNSDQEVVATDTSLELRAGSEVLLSTSFRPDTSMYIFGFVAMVWAMSLMYRNASTMTVMLPTTLGFGGVAAAAVLNLLLFPVVPTIMLGALWLGMVLVGLLSFLSVSGSTSLKNIFWSSSTIFIVLGTIIPFNL